MRLSIVPTLILLFFVTLFSSCKKEVVSRNLEFEALNPAQPDTTARLWKPILLSAPDEFTIDAPGSTTSSDYVAEINEIRGLQANLNSDQKDLLEYWSAGGILRWNEILRELVAKHNLPPYQNEDGVYPLPNSANPFSYPEFPFSNPPYAARAYAYVSAAQYDALVAANYLKSKYKRPSPNKINSDVSLLVPSSQVSAYAYPSEQSVIDAVTVEVLKLLFPTEIAYVQQKAQEHKISRMIAGASTRSDLEAGEKLGKLVAAKFVSRARADKAGRAVGDATLWNKLENSCVAGGETPWISLDSPKRPPMLPSFGAVKGFLIDSLGVINSRPPAPPSTNSEDFKNDLKEVLWYSEHQTKERFRIVNFWADGAGTYTPPGHWNAIACETFVKQKFSEVRWARNLALLNMAMMDAAICCWDAKYYFFNPRPSQMDKNIKSLTGVPNFPAYTSGHSTFSGAAATLLAHIVPSEAGNFDKYAKEASMSRLYGALHYRRDCEEGLKIGNLIGNKAIERAKSDGAN